MRQRKSKSGGFFLTLLLNLLLNFEWTIPGFVFLGLYIWLKQTWLLWCMIGAFALFVIYILLWTVMLKLMNKCSNAPVEHRENKNPYSKGAYSPTRENINDK